MRTRPTPSIRAGLCSVTFRELSVDEIIELTSDAGLSSIEWGGDVHVPPGDIDTARSVGERTRAAGLDVASLGSYYRCDAVGDFPAVLSSAAALGAPRIRVWAGEKGSADASASDRGEVSSSLDNAALHAAEYGIELALEFHSGTLTDTAESALELLTGITATNVSCYWQPSVGADDDQALADLSQLAPWVSSVHVFSWWPTNERQPLASREALWTRALSFAAALPGVTDALIEFVPDDDPAVLAGEAASLRSWLA
ncbi:sugar phosphate isomerase/epimerase [Okibacterium sp. HSC-33S16]|uniref:sugar phosphate isomerase/epimerase family protein n=1 Tax=Okibacterium sp. HSC-33S16 TaxID=2910965 RepID=UPI0020A05DF2|nr:TIM barrel protein [Okibacterium sp. HSC-33S16]MCP2032265.1 sugar phosphate isomerase/epimerase [Okibacterium sp. HSC-33S16]